METSIFKQTMRAENKAKAIRDQIVKDLESLHETTSNDYNKSAVREVIKLLGKRSPIDVAYALSQDFTPGVSLEMDAKILETILYVLWEAEDGE